MKKILYPQGVRSLRVLTLLAVCAMLCSCNTDWGAMETINYPINGEYTALDISNAFQVSVSVRETEQAAVVTIGEKAHQYVQLEVKNGTLYIGMKKWNFVSNEKPTVVLPAGSTMDLEELRLSGASSFNGTLFGDNPSMKVSGASRFDGTIHGNADNLEVELSGASYAILNGFCDGELKIDISGASVLDGTSFPCTKINGEISGASHADVVCCESLKVDISGASELTYSTPSDECDLKVDCECSGASSVHSR